jgi:hypothetical protein
MGRKPTPADPIIPNFFKRGHHSEKSVYHQSRDAFATAGLFWKGHHACRHAFITTVRRRGANPLYLERITHNASGNTVDHYTHTEWEPLCEVVSLLPWVRSESLPATQVATRIRVTGKKGLNMRAGEGIRSLDLNRHEAGNSGNEASGEPETRAEIPEESSGAAEPARHVAEHSDGQANVGMPAQRASINDPGGAN